MDKSIILYIVDSINRNYYMMCFNPTPVSCITECGQQDLRYEIWKTWKWFTKEANTT